MNFFLEEQIKNLNLYNNPSTRAPNSSPASYPHTLPSPP